MVEYFEKLCLVIAVNSLDDRVNNFLSDNAISLDVD